MTREVRKWLMVALWPAAIITLFSSIIVAIIAIWSDTLQTQNQLAGTSIILFVLFIVFVISAACVTSM